MQWYYAINGQRQGPVIQTEFDRLVREGVIRSDTLVWRQGMPDWVPYSQVAPATPPPTPGLAGGVPVPVGAEGSTGDDTAICAVSGKRYPKREMIQYEGKWVSAEHRDEFFQRMREGVAQPNEMVFGGFWIRFRAKFIDGLLLWLISMVTNLVFGVGVLGRTFAFGDSHSISGALALQGLLMLVNIAVGLLYDWFFVSRYQATPGKMAVGLIIVRSDGSALTTGRIIGRHFADMLSSLILGIGYIMAAFDDEKRALHDHICDTRVIKTR